MAGWHVRGMAHTRSVAIALVAVFGLVGAIALSGAFGRAGGDETDLGRGTPTAAAPGQSAATSDEPAAGFDFATSGWGWRRVASPAPGHVSAVPGGYLGECVANGEPAICTSSDAVTWSLNPDPAILSPGQPARFQGWNVVKGGSFWVATSGLGPELWRSSDGRHWDAVALDIGGLQRVELVALGDRVALVATRFRADPSPSVHVSADGTTWTELVPPAGATTFAPAGPLGVVAAGRTDYAGAAVPLWSSADGMTWQELHVPEYVHSLGDVVRLPTGGFAAIGGGGTFGAAALGTLLTSRDGITWEPASAILNSGSLTIAAGRAVRTGFATGTDFFQLLETRDGSSWREVADIDAAPFVEPSAGAPASMRVSIAGLGSRLGLFDGSRLVAVGVPIDPGSGVSVPSPASPLPSGSPGTAQAGTERIAAGWRWHPLQGLTLDGSFAPPVVRLPRGYLGRCVNALCTSTNGWSWQSPPDPGIFRSEVPARFHPYTVVVSRPVSGPAIFLMRTGEGFWRSLDGLSWAPLPGPEIASADLLLAGPDGFAVFGSTDGAPRTYLSADGLTWSKGPADQPAYGGCYGDTSAGVIAGVGSKTAFKYTTDGRRWVAISPQGLARWGCPRRLADGSLLAVGNGDDESFARSIDGRTWTKLAAPLAPQSTAVSASGIVTKGMNSTGTATEAWASIDNGRTFVRFPGVSDVAQLADLVAVRMGDGWWVGAPLPPDDATAPTPTPSISFGSPQPYSPEPTPSSGISEETAIEIAVKAAAIPAEQVGTASARVERDPRYGKWVWTVSFTEYSGGPLDGRGTIVDVDLFTGEVLSVGEWIS